MYCGLSRQSCACADALFLVLDVNRKFEGEGAGLVEVLICIVIVGGCIDGSVSAADVCILGWFLDFLTWVLFFLLFCDIGNYCYCLFFD